MLLRHGHRTGDRSMNSFALTSRTAIELVIAMKLYRAPVAPIMGVIAGVCLIDALLLGKKRTFCGSREMKLLVRADFPTTTNYGVGVRSTTIITFNQFNGIYIIVRLFELV